MILPVWVQSSPVQQIFGPGSDQFKFALQWYGQGLEQSTLMELARCHLESVIHRITE